MAPLERQKFERFTVETLCHYKAHPAAYVAKCRTIQEAAKQFDWEYVIGDWIELIETAKASSGKFNATASAPISTGGGKKPEQAQDADEVNRDAGCFADAAGVCKAGRRRWRRTGRVACIVRGTLTILAAPLIQSEVPDQKERGRTQWEWLALDRHIPEQIRSSARKVTGRCAAQLQSLVPSLRFHPCFDHPAGRVEVSKPGDLSFWRWLCWIRRLQ